VTVIIADFASNSKPLSFKKRRPSFVDPGTFLEGELQNLFDLCYFAGKELVPTGWNVVDEDKKYPRLSSRNPQVFQSADESDQDHDMTNGRAASESSSDNGGAKYQDDYSNHTRMNEESDEDEVAPRPPTVSLSYSFHLLLLPLSKFVHSYMASGSPIITMHA